MGVGGRRRRLYHLTVDTGWKKAALWIGAICLSVLPWAAARAAAAAPVLAAVACLVEAPWRIRGAHAPSRTFLALASATAFLAVSGGWPLTGAWAILAVAVGSLAVWTASLGLPRPDPADALLLLGWGGAFVLFRPALTVAGGGWLAPLVLLLGARRLGGLVRAEGKRRDGAPAPPRREIQGELIADGVVLAGDGGLRCSMPLSLVLQPGESLAIVTDEPAVGAALGETLAGRRAPLEGRVFVDGEPLREGAGDVAVIMEGEPFVAGPLDDNLAALGDGPLSRGELAAVEEACSLGEVRTELEGRSLGVDGSPLSRFHRLLVLTARVLPSHYRILVVVDPAPWVNAVRAEVWRAALVRASLGRTSVWITGDRDLARRADRVLLWRHGTLVPPSGEGGRSR